MHKVLLFIGGLLVAITAVGQSDSSRVVLPSNLPTVSLSESEFEGSSSSNEISGLLQSSRDIFVSTAGFNFGSVRYRMRGLDSENTHVLINGIMMNDNETGRASWSSWGGLNDAVRNTEVNSMVSASDWAFGGIGGVTNILTRASSYRKTANLSYAASNRSYNNRIMFLYATGLQDNGWSVTLSGSRRWAQEGYVPGTFYDGWSYFVSVERKINNRHSFGFIGFAAPTKRAYSGVSTQEAYDLSGDNFYNANWGYQKGQVRNARVSNFNQPMLQLSHYWTPSEKTKVQTTAYYWFGRGGSTALDWTEANDPRPDYYRNLPSYYLSNGDLVNYQKYTNLWQNNEAFRQLNWDHFYFANSDQLTTIDNANGSGTSYSGNKSKFVIEDRRMDKNQKGLNINLQHQLNPLARVAGGLMATISKTRHHKRMVDLLGGDFWLDIDKYADQVSMAITDASQNDLLHPNKIVKVGDVYGYDYLANVNNLRMWSQMEYKFSHLEVYAAAELNYTSFWRTGNMKNGRFPENSYGDSEKNNFLNGSGKLGATYAINGRNYIVANGAYLHRAPNFRDAYISPRSRDFAVDGLESEKVMAGDISYVLRAPNLKARLTAYHTQIKDGLWVRSYYHEDLKDFINFIMRNVDQKTQGIELGVEASFSPTLSGHAVFGKSMNIYTNRPVVTISVDNDASLLADNKVVYLKNYYVGGAPQTIASAGLRYNSPKYWFAGITANYFADAYLEPNPDNHTAETLSAYKENDLRIAQILDQPKLDPGFTLDFFGGKSWMINGHYVGINVSVNNLLNNKDMIIWGYEQLRTDLSDPGRFPEKYSYGYGTTYYISLTFRL